ncbi:MAG: hypothetical protein II842_04435 [Butyrivibrio sp.]|nr:hypothetical protein [Butyrivibrio sp.]
MDKTIELYYESAYLKEFDAKVLSCQRLEKDAHGADTFEIVLDRTAFFPEQGGQSSDVGTISMTDGSLANISHVSIDKDGVISHVADREIAAGRSVHGIIDWKHRFSNMQQHTGEHVFSGIVHSRYGYDNVGFHLSDSEVTMDYNGVLTYEDIRDIELLVNRAIWENVNVICRFPDKEELATIDYRSKKELTGDVRIVTIEGYDDCACCAPHVEKTGEVGFLKVVSCQNYKGGVRVSILCGERALMFLGGQQEIVTKLSGMLTTSADKIIPSFEKLSKENADLKAKLNSVNEELISFQIAGIDESKEDVFLIKDAGFDSGLMRKTVNALVEKHAGFCGVFAGSADDGYRFVIGSGRNQMDCKEFLEKLKEICNVKGGGSSQMVQGSLSACNITEILEGYC